MNVYTTLNEDTFLGKHSLEEISLCTHVIHIDE